MKKILIFSLAYFPKHVGGAEVAIKEITERISDIEFHLITNRFDSTLPKTEHLGNVLVHRVGRGSSYLAKILFVPQALFKALSLHRTYRFDAAWAMMSYMTFPVSLMRLMGTSLPYVVTLQEGDPFEYVFERWYIKLWKPLLRAGFRNAAIIQTISTFLASWAERMGGRVIEVIPNGVATAHFMHAVPQSRINEIRDSLNKKMGDVFLITTSRLVQKNAVDDVIRALPHLPQNVRFLVLGVGPDESALHTLAHELKVDDRIEWVGHVAHQDLPAYLQASDIFIRASRSEGMGNSFVEAMAAGLPVIATQEGGIADFLFDEKRNPDTPITGWAVDKNSPQQIADAVSDILASPEKVRAVVATAREMVKEKYDWDLIARDMREKVFKPLLGE